MTSAASIYGWRPLMSPTHERVPDPVIPESGNQARFNKNGVLERRVDPPEVLTSGSDLEVIHRYAEIYFSIAYK